MEAHLGSLRGQAWKRQAPVGSRPLGPGSVPWPACVARRVGGRAGGPCSGDEAAGSRTQPQLGHSGLRRGREGLVSTSFQGSWIFSGALWWAPGWRPADGLDLRNLFTFSAEKGNN